MLPLIIAAAAAGAYLIGSSKKDSEVYARGGSMAKGGRTPKYKIGDIVETKEIRFRSGDRQGQIQYPIIKGEIIEIEPFQNDWVYSLKTAEGYEYIFNGNEFAKVTEVQIKSMADGGMMQDGGMMARGGVTYGDIVTDLTTLNQISKKYHLGFDKKFKYYVGNPYENKKGEYLPNYFSLGDRVFKLKYFDGSFNPFLIELDGNTFVYDKGTNEPEFVNYPNPKWDKDKYYTKSRMADGGMMANGANGGMMAKFGFEVAIFDSKQAEAEVIEGGLTFKEALELANKIWNSGEEYGVEIINSDTNSLNPIVWIKSKGDEGGMMAKGGKVGRKKYTYIPQDEIESISTWNGVSFEGDDILDGAYIRGRNKKYEDGGVMDEEKDFKVKFYIYDESFELGHKSEDFYVTAKNKTEAAKIAEEELLELFDRRGLNFDYDLMNVIGLVPKGEYARGGKVDLRDDAQRFAKPSGWRWKEYAVTDGVVSRAQLAKSPTEDQREEYPEYVYYETRKDHSDKKPSYKYKSI